MPNVIVRGKVHQLEKKTGENSSAEGSYAAPVGILGKLIKKKYVGFGQNMDRGQINHVIYTNADVAIGDRIDGNEVVEDFGNGKYGIK
jgi:hypothetical protein